MTAKSKSSWRRFSGSHSQASVGVIALIAFLLVVSLLPLIAITSELAQAVPDPNFGYTSWGTSETSLEKYIKGSWGECPDDGTADSITVALRATGAFYVKCGIYAYVADDDAGALVGVTEQLLIPADYNDWKTFNFVDPKPSLEANTKYFLVAWGESTTGLLQIRFQSPCPAGTSVRKYITLDGFPDPLEGETGEVDRSYAIYCTYSTEEGPQEYNRPVSQGFSISAIVEIEVEKFAQEYERPVEQGFSLAGLAPSGAEFGRVIEQGFSFGAVVAIVMEICKLLSQTFGITGTVGVTSGLSRSLAQDFSLDESVEAKRELGKSVAQDFSLTGEVEAVVERFAQEYERPIEQGFSLAATIDVDIQWVMREFERDVAQGFSFEGTVMGHEYGDVYIASPWCNGKVNPIIAVDPIFSAIYTVTDNNVPNPAMSIHIQVGTSWNDNDLWDNITAVAVENGQRSSDVTYAGSALTVNSLYWWRCRFGDSNGNWTEWTPPQTFGYEESPFDLVAAAMFIFPIVLMGIAFAFDNVVFASFAGAVFILSGLFFVDIIWLTLIFIGIGIYLLITAVFSEED